MTETQAEYQARVNRCAGIIMNYTGSNYGMQVAKKALRSTGFVVQDISYVNHEDESGKYRLWTIKMPPNHDWSLVWDEKMSDGGSNAKPGSPGSALSHPHPACPGG